jgi:hypothetical protein
MTSLVDKHKFCALRRTWSDVETQILVNTFCLYNAKDVIKVMNTSITHTMADRFTMPSNLCRDVTGSSITQQMKFDVHSEHCVQSSFCTGLTELVSLRKRGALESSGMLLRRVDHYDGHGHTCIGK